jgi:hypothetical protein
MAAMRNPLDRAHAWIARRSCRICAANSG